MTFKNTYFLLIVIVTIVSPLNISAATQENTLTLDRQIANVRGLYSLYDGWDISLRASGSLSSQNALLLAQVDKRLDKYWADASSVITSDNNGVNLTVGVLAEISQQHGSAASNRIHAWKRISRLSKGLSERDMLNQVNKFFNRLVFKSDQENWGRADYWASPIEFLISNAGDCEDFAIAKYFTLKAMGVQIERLRITYVKSERRNQAHMVLAYYEDPTKEPLILDNLTSKILPATKRPDLTPVFSFNG